MCGSANNRFSAARPAAAGILQPEPPDHPEGLDDYVPRKLGTSLDAFGESYGRFDHFEPVAPEPVRQFNLEAVSVGMHRVEFEKLECAPTETFKAAGRIRERHPGDEPDVNARKPAQEQSL